MRDVPFGRPPRGGKGLDTSFMCSSLSCRGIAPGGSSSVATNNVKAHAPLRELAFDLVTLKAFERERSFVGACLLALISADSFGSAEVHTA